MVRIILVRHGETAWNSEGRFQGRIDVELNGVGRRQAEAVAKVLSDEEIDMIYCSPLSRAGETAETIAKYHSIEVKPEEGFIEIDHGQWEGLRREDVIRRNGDKYNQWFEHPEKAKMPGGEGLADIRKRASEALGRIIHKHKDQAILIVAHDAINKVLICDLLGIDNSHFWQFRQGNSGISIIELNGDQEKLTLLNDTCHLGGLVDETSVGAL